MKLADLTHYGNSGIITGLKVIWSNYIVGVELLFNGQSAGVVKGTHNQQIWEENVSLQQGDYIVQFFGRAGNVINCLGIKTAKGYTKVWGNPLEGDSFTFSLQGYFVKALKLGVGEYLQYLEPVFENEMYVNAKKLDFSNNGKFTNTLGKMRNGGESFEDYDWISSKFNYQVAEVKLWHDGTYVHGIQFYYNLDGTKKTPGKHCTESNVKCETLTLGDDEHVVKILVRAGDWIDHITLITDKGRSISAGGSGGQAYVAVAPQYNHFIAVNGSISKCLDTVTFFFDEMP
jgi:hypothetical protein